MQPMTALTLRSSDNPEEWLMSEEQHLHALRHLVPRAVAADVFVQRAAGSLPDLQPAWARAWSSTPQLLVPNPR